MEDVYSSRSTRIRLIEIYITDVFQKCLRTITLNQLPYDHDQDGSLEEGL
jgi:hypothetical protein